MGCFFSLVLVRRSDEVEVRASYVRLLCGNAIFLRAVGNTIHNVFEDAGVRVAIVVVCFRRVGHEDFRLFQCVLRREDFVRLSDLCVVDGGEDNEVNMV